LFWLLSPVFFYCRLAFIPLALVEQGKKLFGAIGASCKMTKGHFWKVFGIGLTIFFISLALGLIFLAIIFSTGGMSLASGSSPIMWIYQLPITIIGMPASMFVGLLIGSLYDAVSLERSQPRQIDPEMPIVNSGL